MKGYLAHLYVCIPCVSLVPAEVKEGLGFCRTGVVDGCEC